MENDQEEDIYSDIWRIKREILDSFFYAEKTISKIMRYSSIGKISTVDYADLKMYTISLYLKLRPLLGNEKIKSSKYFKMQNDKGEPMLDKVGAPIMSILKMSEQIDEMIMSDKMNHNEDKTKEISQIKEWFFMLAQCIKILNIYGVGWVKQDPTNAWKEGLE